MKRRHRQSHKFSLLLKLTESKTTFNHSGKKIYFSLFFFSIFLTIFFEFNFDPGQNQKLIFSVSALVCRGSLHIEISEYMNEIPSRGFHWSELLRPCTFTIFLTTQMFYQRSCLVRWQQDVQDCKNQGIKKQNVYDKPKI